MALTPQAPRYLVAGAVGLVFLGWATILAYDAFVANIPEPWETAMLSGWAGFVCSGAALMEWRLVTASRPKIK